MMSEVGKTSRGNVIFPEFTKKRRVTTGMQTGVLSGMVTEHARKIGALRPNQKFTILEVDVQGDVTQIEGNIESQTVS